MCMDYEVIEKMIKRGETIPKISQTLAEELFDGFAQCGKTVHMETLINLGYDPTSSNAYYFAAESGYINVLELLDNVRYYRFPKYALLAAESNGYMDVVAYIKSTYNI